jgi:UDP-N-acetylenolpyruvoylglucosamine reductase
LAPENELMIDVREYVKLKKYGTLRSGGLARFFCTVNNLDELKEAVTFAKEKEIPFIPLGGGSNMYFSDDGFDGLVIEMKILGITFEEADEANVLVHAGAGENWDGFVGKVVEQKLFGIENLSFIPGTVGASPVQITLSDVRSAVTEIRKNKLPDPEKIGTLGSFFKNPIVSVERYRAIQKDFPDIVAHALADGSYKLSAAWIIDHICHLKGVREGDVGTYENQPLAIVNFANASANDVRSFVKKIKNEVKKKTGIIFEEEVRFIENIDLFV